MRSKSKALQPAPRNEYLCKMQKAMSCKHCNESTPIGKNICNTCAQPVRITPPQFSQFNEDFNAYHDAYIEHADDVHRANVWNRVSHTSTYDGGDA